MYGADLRLELDLKQLKSEFDGVIHHFTTMKEDPELKREIMETYGLYCNPYVPFDTGELASNTYVTRDGTLVYNATSPYNNYHYADKVYEGQYYKKLKTPRAGRQYYKRSSAMTYTKKKYKHPKATDHWNLAFESGPEYKKFLNVVKGYLTSYLEYM